MAATGIGFHPGGGALRRRGRSMAPSRKKRECHLNLNGDRRQTAVGIDDASFIGAFYPAMRFVRPNGFKLRSATALSMSCIPPP
jgi:hypothetical protein